MSEAACTVCRSRKGFKKDRKVIYHHVVRRCVIAGYGENLWALLVSCISKMLKVSTDLVCNTIVFQHLRKCLREVYSGMGTRYLNNIKQKANGHSVVLEVYRNGNICLVVRRCPSVSSKTQRAIVFLVSC